MATKPLRAKSTRPAAGGAPLMLEARTRTGWEASPQRILGALGKDHPGTRQRAYRAEPRPVTDSEGERLDLLLDAGRRPQGDGFQGGLDRGVAQRIALRLGNLDAQHCGGGVVMGQQDPLAIGHAVGDLRAAHELAFAACNGPGNGRARGLQPRGCQLLRRQALQDVRIGGRWKVSGEDGGAALAILEARERCGGLHSGRRRETDPAARRERDGLGVERARGERRGQDERQDEGREEADGCRHGSAGLYEKARAVSGAG